MSKIYYKNNFYKTINGKKQLFNNKQNRFVIIEDETFLDNHVFFSGDKLNTKPIVVGIFFNYEILFEIIEKIYFNEINNIFNTGIWYNDNQEFMNDYNLSLFETSLNGIGYDVILRLEGNNNAVGLCLYADDPSVFNSVFNGKRPWLYFNQIPYITELSQILDYQWTELKPEDFEAAPKIHKHTNNSFGIIKQINGGIQNNENAKLDTFIGPLLYYNNKDLDKQNYYNKEGVYFGYTDNDTHVSIGTPGWEQGAIPYNTESEQLENVYRQIPLNSSIYIPRCVTTGMLTSNGRIFYIPLKIFYIIPAGTKSIKISGKYIIRQNNRYLFTSGLNYTSGWAQQFYYKPTYLASWQTIEQYNPNTETGWYIHYNENYRHSGQITALCTVTAGNSQTTVYNYKPETATAVTSCAAKAWESGGVILEDITLTFSSQDYDPPITTPPW